ncbi:MAG: NAD(P)-dependent oxidoreductase [Dehalococcoidales bacterium]|nr:NAD(P)-dependent oxidoreductase [Dehalococcoidales bacterium]
MRILVTGGFGYLGSHVCDYLQKKGHQVRILSRKPHPELAAWSQQFEVRTGDVADYSSIKDFCNNIDAVIHTAALNEVDCKSREKEALLVNGLGTKNVLQDASKNGVKSFIYFSTFHIYGIPKASVITEETLPDPVTTYAITHYLAECFCRQFEVGKKLKCNILRISNGYGAPLFKSINRWTLVLNDLCSMAFQQKRIALRSKGTQERDFVGIKDILQGVDILLQRQNEDGGNIFNLGSGKNISIITLARMVAEVYQERYKRNISVEIPEDAAEPDIKAPFKFSIEKLKRLGYGPVSDIKEEIGNIFRLLES